MWPGPYGNWGSRKCLMASLDPSLKVPARAALERIDLHYDVATRRYAHRHPIHAANTDGPKTLVNLF